MMVPARVTRRRVLLLSGLVDGTDSSEPLMAFNWVKALSEVHDITLLCFHRTGRIPAREQLPLVKDVVTWPEPYFPKKLERVRALAKPQWFLLAAKAKRWIAEALERGERYDVAHQLFPNAMRYPSPFRHFDIPYIVGPLAGSLETPPKFQKEVGSEGVLGQLRKLDRLRLRYDPALRTTYSKAAAIIGVAPYVKEALSDIEVQRFGTIMELAGDGGVAIPRESTSSSTIKLLHVGRVIRTKGLIDVIRALALLPPELNVRLTSAGTGKDTERCVEEARRLGVTDKIDFLGHVPREQIEELYRTHDIFVFPSFREPTGGVFVEAMRWSLPIIGANRGGAVAVVGEDGGVMVDVHSPEQLAADLAAAISDLTQNPLSRIKYGEAAAKRYNGFGTFSDRARDASDLYEHAIAHALIGKGESVAQD